MVGAAAYLAMVRGKGWQGVTMIGGGGGGQDQDNDNDQRLPILFLDCATGRRELRWVMTTITIMPMQWCLRAGPRQQQ
jgi:hypothetical protein